MELKVVDSATSKLKSLYQATLVLIRPDQIVAWRGSADAQAQFVIDTVLGRAARRA